VPEAAAIDAISDGSLEFYCNDLMKKRLLVIGAGSIGERHIRCFLATGRATVSFVEPNEKLRGIVAERYGVPAFSSVDDALLNEFDAAVIATPAHTHIAITQQCVNRKIASLIEKPLAVNLDGIAELQASSERNNVPVSVAYVYRSHPGVEVMHRTLRDGTHGRPLQLVVFCGQNFPFYRPAYASTYYAKRESGGGAVQDALTHLFNAAQWLIGHFDSVVADAAHQALPNVEVEDTAHVLARHGGLLATYAMNQYQAPNEISICVVCEQGTLKLELHNQRLLMQKDPGASWTVLGKYPLERDEWFIRQANQFMDVVAGDAKPLCPLSEGIHTLKVNLAVLRSLETRRWETVSDQL